MAVTIDIDLRAADVVPQIEAIEAALESLDDTTGDIDLGDDIDSDGITGSIGEIVSSLEELEMDSDRIAQNISESFSEIPDEIKVDHQHNTPSGSTGDGDSTGDDPPTIASGFEQAANKHSGISADGDGSSGLSDIARNQKLGDLFGVDIQGFMTNEDLNWGKNNFAPWAKNKDIHLSDEEKQMSLAKRAFGDSGFGLESVRQMNLRDSQLSEIELEQVKGLSEPLHQDRKNTFTARSLPDTRAELEDQIESHLQEAFGGADAEPFDGTNAELRQSELSGSEMQKIYSRQPGGDFPTSRIGSGGKYTASPDMDYLDRLKRTDVGKRLNSVESLDDAFKGLNNTKSRLGAKFRKFRPTMGKYMQLLAAIIPVAIGLGVQLLGVASALGAVGAAGAAVMGLGLLGHGESMEESFGAAKRQIRDLKSEMFNMAQPAMQQFAPIQARMFDAIPEGLGGVFEEMEGLAQFEDTLFSLGGSLADGLERTIRVINNNEKAISDLSKTFGNILGGGLIDFFEFLIQSASDNKQMIIDLGGALVTLAVVAYEVSMAVSRIVIAMEPLINSLKFISGLLNNKLVIGLLATITYGYLMTSVFLGITKTIWGAVMAVKSFIAFMSFLGSGSFLKGIVMGFKLLISYISVMIAEMSVLSAIAWTVAAAIGIITAGAAVVAGMAAIGGAMNSVNDDLPGGGGGGPRGPGGGGTVYNDNRSITVNNNGGGDYASQKSLEDTVKKVNETNQSQKLPEVNNGSNTSDGNK